MTISPPTRLAVITGAASGIGLATLHHLLREDDDTAVVGVDRAPSPADIVREKRVDWVTGDVAARGTWEAVAAACAARDERGADCLITCAADQVVVPFLEQGDAWRRLFDINVMGVVHAIETVIPGMLARGRGAIAVVCSIVSYEVVDGLGAYSASKAALLQVMRTAALEHARKGIQINGVCPGFVDTPLLDRHLATLDDPAGARAAAERRIPNGRILAPEEIASVLAFLISPKASGMSGAAVMVDGGLTTTFDFDSSAP